MQVNIIITQNLLTS